MKWRESGRERRIRGLTAASRTANSSWPVRRLDGVKVGLSCQVGRRAVCYVRCEVEQQPVWTGSDADEVEEGLPVCCVVMYGSAWLIAELSGGVLL